LVKLSLAKLFDLTLHLVIIKHIDIFVTTAGGTVVPLVAILPPSHLTLVVSLFIFQLIERHTEDVAIALFACEVNVTVRIEFGERFLVGLYCSPIGGLVKGYYAVDDNLIREVIRNFDLDVHTLLIW